MYLSVYTVPAVLQFLSRPLFLLLLLLFFFFILLFHSFSAASIIMRRYVSIAVAYRRCPRSMARSKPHETRVARSIEVQSSHASTCVFKLAAPAVGRVENSVLFPLLRYWAKSPRDPCLSIPAK